MDKVRLLPSGVQGLVPTEAALSSFTMNRSPIVLDTASSVAMGQKVFPVCLRCNTHQSTPDHLLSYIELERRNLFESPALVRDFLWGSGLLDLV
ncbi:hypothetical protein AVEN_126835-1 [Araneus ventricosus]|uniref:Uncharacterized protein n=1 Tax=Araneus ventricosus TaxID=182803 RepID=A0A4Y2HSA3_ARAVE|nr:hypothetical protein AVEN_126835-1 [Araneus ventricosus]